MTIIVLVVVAVAFVMIGCVPKTQPLYNYNGYSESYYAYKKDASDESALKLQKCIDQAIIESGKSRSGRVPPGMYANLGYLQLKAGASKEAIVSFEKEKSVYPESTHFMDRVIEKVRLAEGKE